MTLTVLNVLKTVKILSLGSDSGFFSFFEGVSLLNSNRTVDCELLMVGVQQLEDIFSTLSMNLF